MSRKPGVFDPWRQQDAPAAPAAESAEIQTDASVDAGDDVCFPFRGRAAGVNVWMPAATRNPEAYATARLLDALDLVSAPLRERYNVSPRAPAGDHDSMYAAVADGDRCMYVYVGRTSAVSRPEALRAGAERIARVLLDARADPQVAKKLAEMKVVPYQS